MSRTSEQLPGTDAVVDWVLRIGDSCLVLAQRLSEWMARAPTMEEDVALGNIALDLLGSARMLLTRAGELEGAGRDEDTLAYQRDSAGFRNALLCELPNGDFAVTMLRQFFVDAWLHELWARLAEGSSDETVRGVAAKAVKENAYHLRHSSAWVVRLGDGTEESRRRMLDALEQLWPFTGELLDDDDVDRAAAAAGVAVLPSACAPGWHARVREVLSDATLPTPDADAWMQRGGWQGRHTEHLSYLLAAMQSVQRAYPGASW